MFNKSKKDKKIIENFDVGAVPIILAVVGIGFLIFATWVSIRINDGKFLFFENLFWVWPLTPHFLLINLFKPEIWQKVFSSSG